MLSPSGGDPAPVQVEVDDRLEVGGLGGQSSDGRGGLEQLRGLGERGDELEAPALERVASGDELPSAATQRAHVLELADLVVAAREELQQRPVALTPADALRQQPDERLRAGDERLDALGVIGRVGMRGEVAQLLAPGGEHSRRASSR